MTAYLPGHPDLDGEPTFEPCYCDHDLDAHTGPADECQDCDCRGYAERPAVLATRNALDVDDELNEGRRRDNTAAAVELEQRRHRRLRLVTGGGAA